MAKDRRYQSRVTTRNSNFKSFFYLKTDQTTIFESPWGKFRKQLLYRSNRKVNFTFLNDVVEKRPGRHDLKRCNRVYPWFAIRLQCFRLFCDAKIKINSQHESKTIFQTCFESTMLWAVSTMSLVWSRAASVAGPSFSPLLRDSRSRARNISQ